MGTNFNFKKGELITIATGEYSDYCVNGLFKVLKDFNAKKQLELWAKENNLELGKYLSQSIDGVSYLGFLNKKGFIKDVNYRELHIGNSTRSTLLSDGKPRKWEDD